MSTSDIVALICDDFNEAQDKIRCEARVGDWLAQWNITVARSWSGTYNADGTVFGDIVEASSEHGRKRSHVICWVI